MRYLILLLIALLPAAPSTAQPEDVKMLPRFGEGAAIISRTSGYGDYNFSPVMTDDVRYVFSIGSEFLRDVVFRWDISDMDDDVIAPVPDKLDISQYLHPERNSTARLLIVEPYLMVQVDNYLLKVDMEQFAIEDAVQIDGWEAAYDSAMAHHGDYVAAAYTSGVAVWNIETGERAILEFDAYPAQIASFSQGWIFSLRDSSGLSRTVICTRDLITCHDEQVDGWFSMEVDDVLIFGNTSFSSNARDIEVGYYTFDEGLQPAEPVFPQFADGELVPYRITADGKYILAITPNENTGTQSGGAYIAPRYQGMYAIDGDVELADVGSSRMFGDHFFADWLSLWDAETQMTVDRFSFDELVGRIDCSPYVNCALDGYNHGYHLAQVNDKALLYVTGTNAILLPIEYQRVDDLLTVGEPLFSMPRGDYEKTYITPDGSAILATDADSLDWIDVASGDTREFDLTPYLGEDSRLELLVRKDDVFLQTTNHLLRLSLPELTLLDSISVDNSISEQYLYGSPYFGQRLVAQNEVVGALFDDVVLVWHADGIEEYSIGEFGMTLYPADDGWIIHHLTAGEWTHSVFYCDLLLTDCQTFDLDRQVYAVFSDNRILTGPHVFDDEDTIPPQLWRIEGNELVSLPPLLNLPDARFNPVEIHGDTVLVDGPDVWDTSYAHVYQLWSFGENRRLSRQMLADDGYGGGISRQWLNDYFVMSNGGWVTFLHLPDGRFRYWRMPDFTYPENAIQTTQISERHLLLMTESEITLYSLSLPTR